MRLAIVWWSALAAFGLCCGCIPGLDPAGMNDPNDAAAQVGNRPPIASAGDDQSVRSGAVVSLDGSASQDEDGDRLVYVWTQIIGDRVELEGVSSSRPRFVAPAVERAQTITFRLTVIDGVASAVDDVDVTIAP